VKPEKPVTGTQLEELVISEVSGVSDPANETPGWLIVKSAATGRRVINGVEQPLGPRWPRRLGAGSGGGAGGRAHG
jgi:hypothetical protein